MIDSETYCRELLRLPRILETCGDNSIHPTSRMWVTKIQLRNPYSYCILDQDLWVLPQTYPLYKQMLKFPSNIRRLVLESASLKENVSGGEAPLQVNILWKTTNFLWWNVQEIVFGSTKWLDFSNDDKVQQLLGLCSSWQQQVLDLLSSNCSLTALLDANERFNPPSVSCERKWRAQSAIKCSNCHFVIQAGVPVPVPFVLLVTYTEHGYAFLHTKFRNF